MSCTVVEATEDEVRSGLVGRGLRAFNERVVGDYPPEQRICLNAKSDQGELLGGIRAIVFLHWLNVEVLWVTDAARGKGVGSALLRDCEVRAAALGAHSARLNTFDWQAPAFYAKHGYLEHSRMDDYVKGHALIFFEKRGLRSVST